MKKLLLIASLALVFTSCQKTDYKALGEEYAKRLIDLCEKNDTAAVLALNDSINIVEEEAIADGDTAGVEAMRKALFDARNICAPFITEAKMETGKTKDEAVQDVIEEALEGKGNVTAVTNAIRAANERDKKDGKPSDDKKPVRTRRVR